MHVFTSISLICDGDNAFCMEKIFGKTYIDDTMGLALQRALNDGWTFTEDGKTYCKCCAIQLTTTGGKREGRAVAMKRR